MLYLLYSFILQNNVKLSLIGNAHVRKHKTLFQIYDINATNAYSFEWFFFTHFHCDSRLGLKKCTLMSLYETNQFFGNLDKVSFSRKNTCMSRMVLSELKPETNQLQAKPWSHNTMMFWHFRYRMYSLIVCPCHKLRFALTRS